MKARWQNEKGAIEAIKEASASSRRHREAERAERDGDLERAAELRYGQIPELEKQLAEQEAKLAELHARRRLDADRGGDRGGRRRGRLQVDRHPGVALMEGEVEKLIHMEERLHERVVGQDEAVEAVANAVRRSRAGLSRTRTGRSARFLFLGPTGVGKTELARALAEFLFDYEQAMVRIDMSEYMEKHTVARLIGAPPGYVGYEEGGQLTEAVRRRPYAVVLFDEIEKAHPDVFNVLLQIMDDGRLTDGQGRTVDFKNTVLIMTSNVGSQEIAGERSTSGSASGSRRSSRDVQARVPEPRRRHRDLPPPRSARTSAGSSTSRSTSSSSACASAGIEIELTDDARTLLGNLGYDPTYGARPLKRVIQKQLVDKLALALLEGEFGEGDTVEVDAAAASWSSSGHAGPATAVSA